MILNTSVQAALEGSSFRDQQQQQKENNLNKPLTISQIRA